MAEVGLYADPSIYDILHAPGTAAEVDGLERTAARFVRARPRARPGGQRPAPVWLEPACGTGRYLRVAAARGVRVIGFDLSPAMIAYARRRVRPASPAHLFTADMTSFASHVPARSVDFAFNPINTIRHLRGDAAMLAHFEQVARVLRPGGVYAVGISTSGYGLETPSEDVWEGRRGRVRVRQVVQYVPPTGRGRFERVYSHLTIHRGRRVEHAASSYALRCYSQRQWARLVERSALRIVGLVDETGEDLHVEGFGYGVYVLGRRDDKLADA